MKLSECHVHLYGCLTAQDIFELGKDRWQMMSERLQWFEKFYAKVHGDAVVSHQFWQTDDGPALLDHAYSLRHPESFEKFQARFNLSIALFPASPDDNLVLQHILSRDLREGKLQFAEYRVFVPDWIVDSGRFADFLQRQTQTVRDIEALSGNVFRPRLALSLSRQERPFAAAFRQLLDWQACQPDLGQLITGLDFCGFEEEHGLDFLNTCLVSIARDRARPTLLIHAGETWENSTFLSALRRVWTALELGADRIGHGTALGFDPMQCLGKPFRESLAEQHRHQAWLDANAAELSAYGYRPQSVAKLTGNSETGTYHDAMVSEALRFQAALDGRLQASRAVIESCPTSNHLLGGMPLDHNHPTARLAAKHRVVIGSDDPGIFLTSLEREYEILLEDIGLDSLAVQRLQEFATVTGNQVLARGSGLRPDG